MSEVRNMVVVEPSKCKPTQKSKLRYQQKKRYWLFTGDCYYPKGGFDDFKMSFDKISTAYKWIVDNCKINTGDDNWAHIYDSEKEKIIYRLNDDE